MSTPPRIVHVAAYPIDLDQPLRWIDAHLESLARMRAVTGVWYPAIDRLLDARLDFMRWVA